MTTYKLRTLRDVFDTIPTDRIQLCMREIADGFIRAKQVCEVLNAAAEALGEPAPEFRLPDELEWIDNDEGVITVNIGDGSGGVAGSIQWRPDSSSDSGNDTTAVRSDGG